MDYIMMISCGGVLSFCCIGACVHYCIRASRRRRLNEVNVILSDIENIENIENTEKYESEKPIPMFITKPNSSVREKYINNLVNEYVSYTQDEVKDVKKRYNNFRKITDIRRIKSDLTNKSYV